MFENARWIYVVIDADGCDKIPLIKFLRVLSAAVDGTPCSLKQGKEWAEAIQSTDGTAMFYMPVQLLKMADYLALKLGISLTEAPASLETILDQISSPA